MLSFVLCSTFSHQNISKTNGKANTCSTGTCFIQKIYALGRGRGIYFLNETSEGIYFLNETSACA
jgi:hypothetical protein